MEVCSQNLTDPNTVLLKVNGNICNMSCEYCSELPKQFTDEQCQFDFEKIREILIKLPKDTDIILHGGEPTVIGMDNIQIIINIIHELKYELRPTIQTNGYLGEMWADFFEKNRELVRVSVSIDGNKECNSYRMNKANDAELAFERIDAFLRMIDSRGITFRCIATINSRTYDKGKEIVEYFTSFNNLKFVRLNPCFDIDENGVKQWAITPKQYLQCLKDAFIEMLEKQTYRKFKLDPLMDMMENLKRTSKSFEFKCNKFASVFPNGIITSCDAMREYEQIIDKYEKIFNGFTQPEYVKRQICKCQACSNLSICKGGCPPLMDRYEKYDSNLLEEYCLYRVGIREFICSQMEMVIK